MAALRFVSMLMLVICVAGQDKLVITPAGEEQTVFQGRSFFVSCSSEAANVQRVMWTGPEGTQITDYKGRIHVEDGKSGHKGVDLMFENVTRKDRGVYTCSANVDGVDVEKSFELFVNKPIDFKDTAKVQYLDENQSSTLTCDVDGDPKPRVTWLVNGLKVEYGEKYDMVSERPNDLVVNNVSLRDAGEYRCEALQLSPRTSEMSHLSITVKVHHKPQWIESHMAQAYSYVSGNVNLTCEAVAEPHANFTWMKDNTILAPSDTINVVSESQKSTLMLKVTSDDMFGDYLCKAENRLGTLERVIILEKGKKPPVPKLTVSSAEVSSLVMGLSADGHQDMPVVAFRVQYKTAGDDWSTATTTDFNKGDKYVLTGLAGDTLYVVRASARNAAGLSDFSTEKMERTKKSSLQGELVSSSTSTYSAFSSTLALLLLCYGAL